MYKSNDNIQNYNSSEHEIDYATQSSACDPPPIPIDVCVPDLDRNFQ